MLWEKNEWCVTFVLKTLPVPVKNSTFTQFEVRIKVLIKEFGRFFLSLILNSNMAASCLITTVISGLICASYCLKHIQVGSGIKIEYMIFFVTFNYIFYHKVKTCHYTRYQKLVKHCMKLKI